MPERKPYSEVEYQEGRGINFSDIDKRRLGKEKSQRKSYSTVEYGEGKGINFLDQGEDPEKWKQFRKDSLELSDTPEGFNIERVYQYVRDLGIEPKPVVFVTDSNKKEYADLYKKFYEEDPEWVDDTVWGHYDAAADVAVIFLYKDEHESSIYFESIMVHELIHASSGHKEIIVDSGGRGRARVGNQVGGSENRFGHFLEEGVAEYYAADYLTKFMPRKVKQTILHKGKEKVTYDKIKQFQEMLGSNTDVFEGEQVPLLTFRMIDKHSDQYNYVTSAAPAYAMQLLSGVKPELLPALLEARNSVQGLRKVARIIDSINQGLYVKLRGLHYNERDFITGLRIVKSALEEYKQHESK